MNLSKRAIILFTKFLKLHMKDFNGKLSIKAFWIVSIWYISAVVMHL